MSADTVKQFSDLRLGVSASHSAVVDEGTISDYAALTGDHNPIHEDRQYAEATRFGKPVAHGLLVAGYVQTALTKIVAPGGVSTSYQFDLLAPTFAGAAITARAECAELNQVTRRATFAITVDDDESRTQLIRGTAVVAFPKGDPR